MQQQPNLKSGNVFLGCITHNGQLDFRMARILYAFASAERMMMTKVQQSSLLASACNDLWCSALNKRKELDLKWFVLLHADIVPPEWFVDRLIDIAEKHDADLLSAVVPIKQTSGVTSTAISGPDNFTRLTRLTMKQINHPNFPETFNWHDVFETFESEMPPELTIDFPHVGEADKIPFLLVNTGCMVCRLDREWCNNVHFTINDRITQGLGGIFEYQVEPEDWYFSRRVAELGGKVMATRALAVEHIGTRPFRSNEVWGDNIDAQTLQSSVYSNPNLKVV